jgi:multiple sugar transport system permease protein
MQVVGEHQTRQESGLYLQSVIRTVMGRIERGARFVFLMPAVLALLFLSIFPLIASLYLSLTRFQLAPGGFKLNFIGIDNYKSLFEGSEQTRFLGKFADLNPIHWLLMGMVVVALGWSLRRYVVSGRHRSIGGFIGRVVMAAGLTAFAYVLVRSLVGGRLGSLMVTLLFVVFGIVLQYGIGLGLAVLASQDLAGRRFFRVVFLLPMMITPVGVAYMFRMVTDTGKGPLNPLFQGLGLANWTWVNDPWGARAAIVLTDTWQWVPFMFIVLLAALESQPVDVVEAATVDGASPWEVFRSITWPGIFPISLTLVLIRMIESFKIIDLPNVMTGGGPGTTTESMTLHAFINWRASDYGTASAIAYVLLITVTFFATVLVQLIRQRSLGSEQV